MTEITAQGRTWVFDDNNINTDLIMPQAAFAKPVEEQAKLVFTVNRPGWVDMVNEGDILIAGRNFGTGSSRPGALLFKQLGIKAIIAESINGLFYRNCINYALPAMECPGITKFVAEGDVIRINFNDGLVENISTNNRLKGQKVPEFLLNIVESGGVLQQLKKEGYLL